MALALGTRLGPYEILSLIGSGGMGEVYRARDIKLRRDVALKVLPEIFAADLDRRARFTREAHVLASLNHPNIAAIYGIEDTGEIAGLAMELVEGATLADRIQCGPLAIDESLKIATQIADALDAAHEKGVVHRDLKPANIFTTRDGQVKLLDFGLATEAAAQQGTEATRLARTEVGAVLGTAGYMSPEQARGERADARSDIFSFGCVLYEMLVARRAFTGNTWIETLHAVLKDNPSDLTNLRGDVPASLDRVVRRCLEKAPESRFQTARDLGFALEGLTTRSEPAAAHSQPASRRLATRSTIAISAVALAGLAGALWWNELRQSGPAETTGHAEVPQHRRHLLAVLPFENISRDGEAYFAAGMTQEVTSQLSKLSALRLVGNTAVAQFKDPRHQLSALAKDLGVGSVVTGTVREQGALVRVNVELIDAASGQVIWSEQYDREGVDVFAAQSDIALRVGAALNASVTLEEQARIGKHPTSSVTAYELFVRARTSSGQTPEERLKDSIDLLRRAVALDPKFAEAYSAIANDCYLLGAYGDLPSLTRGVEAANKALEIDPQLASGYHSLALNLHQLGRLREALPAYRKAVALDPSYTAGLQDLSFGENTAGRYNEALKYGKGGLDLTSNTAVGYYHVGVSLLQLDDDQRAERFLTTAAARFPSAMRLKILLSLLDLRRGRPQPALDRIRAAAEKAPENIEVLLTRAEIETFAGAADAPSHVASLLPRAADGLFHNAPYPVKLAHAYHLLRRGATVEAGTILNGMLAANRKAVADGADWPMVFMQNAAVHALQGQRVAALDELDRAYAAGWRDGRTLAIDPFFTAVRAEHRFTQLLARIESDVSAMRARADYSGFQ
jgi:eukaryotic-like serine/threonine-protein kinase